MAKLAGALILEAPKAPQRKRKSVVIGYKTARGTMFQGTIEAFLQSPRSAEYAGKVQLIFTSPPFPLNRKKAYGNKQGEEFSTWLADLAPNLKKLLTPTGSIVMEMGTWASSHVGLGTGVPASISKERGIATRPAIYLLQSRAAAQPGTVGKC